MASDSWESPRRNDSESGGVPAGKQDDEARPDFYNLGNGEGYSNRQVLDTVREVTGTDFPARLADRRPGAPAICVASSERAHHKLGCNPQHTDLEEIVASAWAFHRARYGLA